MLGCLNPNLGKIWINANVGVKNAIENVKLKVGLKFEFTFV